MNTLEHESSTSSSQPLVLHLELTIKLPVLPEFVLDLSKIW